MVAAISSVSPSQLAFQTAVGGASPGGPAPRSSFGELLEKIGRGVTDKDLLGTELQQDLNKTRDALLGGQAFSPRELLLYQVKAGELSMRVELVSKVADAFLGTLKKLQNQP